MTTRLLRVLTAAQATTETRLRAPVYEETLADARRIVADVQRRGESALREYALKFKEVEPDQPLVISRAELNSALAGLPSEIRALLERVADRIRRFSQAQLDALREVRLELPGGRAGHRLRPVSAAGCYAPGGRYPLPSSVLMTVIPARVAGVDAVWVASPRPAAVTLAAAAVAGADGLLRAGGAHAIAALAYGVGGLSRCDIVVGPGNRWVTAAKHVVSATTGIDMLAGPSELVVLADSSADARLVAADLLAQAEHDDDARPILVSIDPGLVDAVERELADQLASLPTAATARAALRNGFAAVARHLNEAIALCDQLAPEHLELHVRDAAAVGSQVTDLGGLFLGSNSAEVIGDYGAGPNHVLPTGGTARFRGGLSVFDFIRVQTWLQIDDAAAARELFEDAAELSRIEQLAGHARSAEMRLAPPRI